MTVAQGLLRVSSDRDLHDYESNGSSTSRSPCAPIAEAVRLDLGRSAVGSLS